MAHRALLLAYEDAADPNLEGGVSIIPSHRWRRRRTLPLGQANQWRRRFYSDRSASMGFTRAASRAGQ